MISVVIPAHNDALRLTATLAALAPAAVDGFVRQVIVADGGSTDETCEVAEESGADVVLGGVREAIAAARQPWLLVLAAGVRPQVGWERAAHAHMRDYPEHAGWFDPALPGAGLLARVRELAALTVFDRTSGTGPLVTKQRLAALSSVEDLSAISRAIRPVKSRRIGARALVMSRP
jgi:glycosyltransferase involved in cell wall biosynthesis